jgi:hypothetical protein
LSRYQANNNTETINQLQHIPGTAINKKQWQEEVRGRRRGINKRRQIFALLQGRDNVCAMQTIFPPLAIIMFHFAK